MMVNAPDSIFPDKSDTLTYVNKAQFACPSVKLTRDKASNTMFLPVSKAQKRGLTTSFINELIFHPVNITTNGQLLPTKK
jgi:hypothetical protein